MEESESLLAIDLSMAFDKVDCETHLDITEYQFGVTETPNSD